MIHVAKLSPIEKLAIDLIRGCRPARLGSDDCQDFVRLTQAAKGAGMVISALDCPYLGDDEATLLGCLALLQRQRAILALELDPQLLRCLARGAERLAGYGGRLEYRNVARISPGGSTRRKRAWRSRKAPETTATQDHLH